MFYDRIFALEIIKKVRIMTHVVKINKGEVMRNAHCLHNSSMNKLEKIPFGEFLSWEWAIAKQSLLSYILTGYMNDYIIIEN
jgi:hypothetical protein